MPFVDTAKHRSLPAAWVFWLSGVIGVGALWCFRKVIARKRKLSRAEEKQRRKARVREAMIRK